MAFKLPRVFAFARPVKSLPRARVYGKNEESAVHNETAFCGREKEIDGYGERDTAVCARSETTDMPRARHGTFTRAFLG